MGLDTSTKDGLLPKYYIAIGRAILSLVTACRRARARIYNERTLRCMRDWLPLKLMQGVLISNARQVLQTAIHKDAAEFASWTRILNENPD